MAPSATVSHSVVGEGAVVGVGAVVEDSVLLPGASVGDGARVRDSIVAGTVGARANLLSCVVGSAATIAEGLELTGARVPDPTA